MSGFYRWFQSDILQKHQKREGKSWMKLPSPIHTVFIKPFEGAKNGKYADEYLAMLKWGI
jgi:hypothetical protein